MASRRSKQFFYGIFYLAILAIIIYGIYLIFKPAPSCFDNIQNEGETGVDCGGPCAPCTFNLTPLQVVGQVKILPVDGNHVSLLAQIQNSNQGFGVASFDYQFSIYDQDDNFIASSSGNSYIYPGQLKYVSIPLVAVSNIGSIGRASLTIGKYNWQTADNFRILSSQIQGQQVATTTDGVKVFGYLYNGSSFTIPSAELVAIFYSQSGLVAGVSKTEISNIASLQSFPFTINHPPINYLNNQATQVLIYIPPSQ
ncbi:MAG: hypothetical protein M1334_02420 [Patescibacteria group bacterium]|nr:hypothetical protein [Patescibacteria group bacterium]